MTGDALNRVTDDDRRHIAAQSFVSHVDFHDELASTNDRAAELCRGDDVSRPALVLTARQTAGRGRGGNRWWAADGALTFSLVLDTHRPGHDHTSLAVMSLVAALGIADAIDALLGPSHRCRVKWPNDVYVSGRKICGILPERPHGDAGPLIVGIGLNVNNSTSRAPDDIQSTAVALCDIDAQPRPLAGVLIEALRGLEQALMRFTVAGEGELQSWWQSRCLLTGCVVRALVGSKTVTGLCRGITDRGALIVDTAGGRETLISATIASFDQP
jgi:BirA family biotin operon repressor/biotin-[acetyl-CoA-carboxylase] ligase